MAEANFHKLQRIQNRAVRIVCDVTATFSRPTASATLAANAQ